MKQLPYRIETMIAQMGGGGMRGALAYVGASQLTYKEREDEMTPGASKVTEAGAIEIETGLIFKVNGNPKTWKMIVSLEPSDTYTVRLWEAFTVKKMAKTGKVGQVLDTATDVYCDQLQSMIETMYDEAIKKHNGGWIRI